MKYKVVSFLPAIAWFIISVILLCLPGKDLPEVSFFDIPNRDKLIHIVMFFLLCGLFCWPFKFYNYNVAQKRSWFLSIAFYAIAYGIVMEFVQKYFIPNRSYDVWDIAADSLGSVLGYLGSLKFFIKPTTKRY